MRVRCFLAMFGVLLLPASFSAELQLRYRIGLLSNAESAVPAVPGAAGTKRSFLLRHQQGNWSRFNWPIFRPVPGLRELVFQAKRETPGPAEMAVRLLGTDGVEWQATGIELGTEWREYHLTAADFRFFRGGKAEDAGELDLGRAVQFQIVPASAGAEKAQFRLDEIRFLPDGPSYTADDEDLAPELSPEEMRRQRLEDLIGRWRYEQRRLARDTDQARSWLAELAHLQGDQQETWDRLAQGGAPWQQVLPPLAPSGYRLTAADYAAKLARIGTRPVAYVDLMAPGCKARESSLYDALRPPAPSAVTEGGRRFLRQPFRFTDAETQQTVFLNVDLAAPVSVEGRMLEIDLCCPAGPLNDRYPLLVRLYVQHPEGLEAWADLSPSEAFNGEWQTIRFDPNSPTRAVRYEPTAVKGISFRLENAPGKARDVALDVGEVRLDWPPAEDVLREQMLAEELAAVHRGRQELYGLRDRIAVAEDGLRSLPDAWRRYLASFQPAPLAVAPLPSRLASGPEVSPEKFDWTFSPQRAGVAVTARLRAGPTADRLVGEFLDGETVLASGETTADGVLMLPLPAAATWSARRPFLGTLRLAAYAGEELVARFEKAVRPGVVTVAPAPATSVLRHLRQRRQPDWTVRENGRAWFPRMACYNWENVERTVAEGHRMFDDLWVDGLRRYGFDNHVRSWDVRDRLGVPFLHTLGPNYRTLTNWKDVAGFREDLLGRLSLIVDHANRPFQAVVQSGNEVELSIWGASLPDAFPGALYQPLDMGTEMLGESYARRSPLMYVRAGTFRAVPPLPHEDISGINQYTGRYSGRQDEVGRNLAELAREGLFCNRPLMITEWMGPKYSWATGGIGGVTPRGAAYYLERYWRAMIRTPGIVGSSEFTLNWVVAPFEDLTNQSREEAWKTRPRHQQFGGGHTADHVPLVGPEDVVRGPTYRSMQAFHGPLYLIANVPGELSILHGERSRGAAVELAAAMGKLGKATQVVSLADASWSKSSGHWLVLLHPDDPAPDAAPLANMETALAGPAEPLIRKELFPGHPDRMLVCLSAPDAEAYARGEGRLLAAASAMVEMNEREGAMGRVVALVDSRLRKYYEYYLLEFAARGYAFGGDDTRETLDAAEFLDGRGERRPAWERLTAVILDTTRELTDAEWQLLDKLQKQGVHLVMSLPCWQANPRLQQAYPATVGDTHPMADTFTVLPQLRQPIAIPYLGGADMSAIRRFQPRLADSPHLQMHELQAAGTRPLATAANGAPVAVAWMRGEAVVFLLGCPIGDVVEIHRRVTHSGTAHPIYDRDTACGLERLSFFVVNATRLGRPGKEARPRLYIETVPESTLVPDGQPVRAAVRLADAAGQPVAGGQLRVRVRRVIDGKAGWSTEYVDLPETEPGVFRIECPTGQKDGSGLRYLAASPAVPDCLHLVSFQIKGYAPGHIPADAGLAVALAVP